VNGTSARRLASSGYLTAASTSSTSGRQDIVSIRLGFDARALVLIEREERGWRRWGFSCVVRRRGDGNDGRDELSSSLCGWSSLSGTAKNVPNALQCAGGVAAEPVAITPECRADALSRDPRRLAEGDVAGRVQHAADRMNGDGLRGKSDQLQRLGLAFAELEVGYALGDLG